MKTFSMAFLFEFAWHNQVSGDGTYSTYLCVLVREEYRQSCRLHGNSNFNLYSY